MTKIIEIIGEQAKQICRAAVERLDTGTQAKRVDGINTRSLVLGAPSGNERLSISQIIESPVAQTVDVVVIKSEVATPSLNNGFQTGFTLHLDTAILPLNNRKAGEMTTYNTEIFGDSFRITALVNAISRWPVLRLTD